MDSVRASRLRFAVSILFVAAATAFAGVAHAQTGTIQGKVVDQNGVPLQGVSVIVVGAQTGGFTNAEGEFKVLKVPVGSYTIRAIIASHEKQDRPAIVDANRATLVNFSLGEKVTKIKGIEVKGDVKIAINKKSSSTKQVVTSEDLRSLPVDSYKDAIGLKAGVINQGGELHFRGGRANEVLTIVNGIPSRNPLNAEGVDLGLLAVSSSEQVLGGLDAQFGNALSGVINLTTREGGDKLAGEVRYFTDRYGEAEKAFNNYERVSLGVGGPFLFPKTNYFISLEGTFNDTNLKSTARQREHRLLDFIRIGNRQSNDTRISSKLTYKVTPNAKLNTEVILNRSTRGRFHNRWNRNGFVHVRQDSTAPTDGSISERYGTWAYYQVSATCE